jgi:hypothetical protein
MDDVARDIAREKLRVQLKAAKSVRELVLESIQRGTSLPYLSMRYGIDLWKLEQAKRVLEQQEKKREKQQPHSV